MLRLYLHMMLRSYLHVYLFHADTLPISSSFSFSLFRSLALVLASSPPPCVSSTAHSLRAPARLLTHLHTLSLARVHTHPYTLLYTFLLFLSSASAHIHSHTHAPPSVVGFCYSLATSMYLYLFCCTMKHTFVFIHTNT